MTQQPTSKSNITENKVKYLSFKHFIAENDGKVASAIALPTPPKESK